MRAEVTARLAAHRALNVHPLLPPHYRGAAPIQWQLANQEEEIGVLIQQLGHSGFDTGPILLQKPLHLPCCPYHHAKLTLADLADFLPLPLHIHHQPHLPLQTVPIQHV
ncbi:hypothetical protein PCANC_00146 [Puccinia coronata f. sp. avenae]|jgi:methionyl-tRNA formyltransferase|uniref:Formyl transferase N-terminal domain-containing protein n=1 Tax=Puccinia coronata f. sp. avenae TaxID=200324 RepID=A0A2N5W8K2_9BASI|nr:hypothetical protein PCASD_14222 [Puccinia coronata f. sp. avenae]PLW58565.1 hypothetical protein PCANC_00146 [Puccinia coronata f. sp. avenae]